VGGLNKMNEEKLHGTTIHFYYEDRKKDESNKDTYYAGMNSFYNDRPIRYLQITNDDNKKVAVLDLKTMKLKVLK
jgi:hypothetical protein